MTPNFRAATEADVADVLKLLQDDSLGATRESADPGAYLAAFRRMQSEANNHLIVGDLNGCVAATYQLTFISGLSLRAALRAQIESVRVASAWRGQKIGASMLADAERRARAAGCSLLQLTMNRTRTDTARFYERLGFTPSHIGYKRELL